VILCETSSEARWPSSPWPLLAALIFASSKVGHAKHSIAALTNERYGKKFVGILQAFKNAEAEIEAETLALEATWSRTALQLEVVKRISESGAIGDEHCRIHLEVFEMLKTKLMLATTKIESMVDCRTPGKPGKSGVKRLKYSFLRDTLKQVMMDLERWQRIFDPTWFLLLRVGDSSIDREMSRATTLVAASSKESSCSNSTLSAAKRLRAVLKDDPDPNLHISLPEDGLNWKSTILVGYSTTRLIQRMQSQRLFAVSTINCEDNVDVPAVREDAESLARKLKQIDPNIFGILACHGLVKRKNRETGRLSSIEMVFRLPHDTAYPASLRYHLLQPPTHSLTRVLEIARQLAKAVSFIHTACFVHKNIRPETILVFPNSEEQDSDERQASALGSAYILGFDSFRSVNFRTNRKGDEAWERNLYRHPLRQGLRAHEDYIMQHDVYSLGVCLLELGLWESFIHHEKNTDDGASERTVPVEILGLSPEDFELQSGQPQESLQKSNHIKEQMVELAKAKLPARMGDKYTAVVVTCLTCLDEGNEDFGNDDDLKDEDGIVIGAWFIERILFKLDEISL
jgi:hypothetical protein